METINIFHYFYRLSCTLLLQTPLSYAKIYVDLDQEPEKCFVLAVILGFFMLNFRLMGQPSVWGSFFKGRNKILLLGKAKKLK